MDERFLRHIIFLHHRFRGVTIVRSIVLLPWVLRAWVPVTPLMVCACGALTWLTVRRFAPYPLVDLWAAALMLAALVALQRRTAIGLMGAGVLAGAAFNVRPAYLLPLLLVLGVVLLSRRLAGLWFAAGTVVALVPQFLVNLGRGGSWTPWPPDMLWLTQTQASLASFVVRYDTILLTEGDPRQVFCSPSMATAVGDHPPGSTGELAVFYLQNLPQSIVFVAEKVAAVLHWPLSGPYAAPTGAGDLMFALLVTVVTVVGAVSLARAHTQAQTLAQTLAQTTRGFRPAPVAAWAAGAVWLGSLITIITASPETRFAVPLVLLGVAGCAALVGGRPSRRWNRRWIAGAGMAVAVVFAIGLLGLSHPAAPGSASPFICSAT